MKKITQQQLDTLLRVIYDLNAPVKTYEAVQKMFAQLPVAVEEVKQKKNGK